MAASGVKEIFVHLNSKTAGRQESSLKTATKHVLSVKFFPTGYKVFSYSCSASHPPA